MYSLNGKLILSRRLVGIYDKAKKEVVLYDADHVYSMNRVIRGVDNSVADRSFEVCLHIIYGLWNNFSCFPKNVDQMAQRRLLVDTFGSQKRQRAARSAEAGRVTVDNIVAGESLHSLFNAQVNLS